jgi:hypothetical protein
LAADYGLGVIIFLDANVLVADPRLKSERWAQLAGTRGTFGTRIAVPQIAVEEAKAQFQTWHEKIVGSVVKASRGMSSDARALIEAAIVQTKQEASDYPAWLDAKLEELHVQLLPPPVDDHLTVALRAIARTRPFKESGDGYRDTLHWLSLLELVSDNDDDYVLVTGDAAFRGAGEELHPSLSEEIEELLSDGKVTLVQTLAEVQVPGRYRADVNRPDLEDPLLATLRDAILGAYLMQSADPTEFGLLGVDWVEVAAVAPEELELVAFTARELTGLPMVEIEFEVDVILQFLTSTVVGSEPDLGLSHASIDRKVRFSGTALATKNDDAEIDSISELSVTLILKDGTTLADVAFGYGGSKPVPDDLRRAPKTIDLWP